MFYNSIPLIKPRVIPPLDDSFRPAVLWNRAFLDAVYSSGEEVPLALNEKQTPSEKLKSVQGLMTKGDDRASKVFETIGCYLGYGIAYYADFYDIKHILILGRVTSGEGGQIILQKAEQVLKEDFPELFKKITLHLPDESNRRTGQSIAAASLPLLKGS